MSEARQSRSQSTPKIHLCYTQLCSYVHTFPNRSTCWSRPCWSPDHAGQGRPVSKSVRQDHCQDNSGSNRSSCTASLGQFQFLRASGHAPIPNSPSHRNVPASLVPPNGNGVEIGVAKVCNAMLSEARRKEAFLKIAPLSRYLPALRDRKSVV